MRRENMKGKFSRREFVKLATVTLTTVGLSLSGSAGLAVAEQKRPARKARATNGRRTRHCASSSWVMSAL